MRRWLLARSPIAATLWFTLLAAVLTLVLSQAGSLVIDATLDAKWAAVALACTAVVAPLLVWPLLRLWSDTESARAQLDVLATRDDLTGAFNRRQFLVLADREWARCKRYEMTAALLMIDVDHFKRTNDLNGHLAGDLLLREISHAAGRTLRQADLFGRFGGEEFIAYLPHTDTLGALDAAERIREAVARLALEWRGQTMRSTVSVGVVSLDHQHESLGALIADADLALYAAKDAGRNCVRTAPMAPSKGRPFGVELPQGGVRRAE